MTCSLVNCYHLFWSMLQHQKPAPWMPFSSFLIKQKMSLMVTQQQKTQFGGTIRNIASHFATAHKKRMAAQAITFFACITCTEGLMASHRSEHVACVCLCHVSKAIGSTIPNLHLFLYVFIAGCINHQSIRLGYGIGLIRWEAWVGPPALPAWLAKAMGNICFHPLEVASNFGTLQSIVLFIYLFIYLYIVRIYIYI